MENRRRRILLVDDHPVVRKGVRHLIAETEDLCVCGEAETAAEVPEKILAGEPDLVLLDLFLGDIIALDLIRAVRKRHPALKLLVLTMKGESLFVERALKAGADGYIIKEEKSGEILAAVRRVLQGKGYVSGKVDSRMFRRISAATTGPVTILLEKLSNREIEVFKLIAEGSGSRKIAENLSLSVKTVETLRSRMMKKLRLKNSTELVRFAARCSDQF